MLQASIDYRHRLVEVYHRYLYKVLNEYLAKLLSNGKVLVHWVEKILDLFLVYLIKGYMDPPVEETGLSLSFLKEAE